MQSGGIATTPAAGGPTPAGDVAGSVPVAVGGTGGNEATDSTGTVQIGGCESGDGSIGTVQVGGGSPGSPDGGGGETRTLQSVGSSGAAPAPAGTPRR